jgi:dTDP-4-dehydrorhamnose 3,5-epimerase
MRIVSTSIPDVLLLESRVYHDERGFFMPVFQTSVFAAAGLPTGFVQDSQSHSVQHTLRGMHYQFERPQGKLVRAIAGSVFDVVVDLRRGSPTFSHWVGVTLSDGDGRQLWIPPGFAHGFLTLTATADMSYKMTAEYDPASECSLAWNDPTVGIEWPLPSGISPLLAPKDAAAPSLPAARVFSHPLPDRSVLDAA